jgi:predicted GNAT family acetyltransferase
VTVEVRDNPDESRYELTSDGRLAGFALYRLEDGQITFFHTEVEPEYEGSGFGSRLVRAALDDVRKRKLSVVPVCPFFAGYIARHPDEYLDLVVPDMRAAVTSGS